MDDGSFPRPPDAATLINLGRVKRKQRDNDAALEHFLAAQAAAPEDATATLEVAATLIALKRHAEAAAAFERVLAGNPANVAALAGLGDLALRRDDPSAALGWLERAAAADPRHVAVAVQLGRTLRKLDRLDEAEACSLRLLERAPDNAGALTNLGFIARRRGDLAAAIAYFERAVASDPARDATQHDLAACLRAAGRIDEAEACYRAILARSPADVVCLQAVGAIARARGDYAVALASFRAVAAAAPPTLGLQVSIAEMLRELAYTAEAEALYQSILQAHPHNVTVLISYGAFEMKRQNHAAALEAFEAARARAPRDPNVLFRLAAALRGLYRYDDAGAILTEIARIGGADAAELRRQWFEHYCLTLNLSRAAQCLAEWGGHGGVPASAVVMAARLYAALGRWSDLLAFFRERIVEPGWVGRLDALAEPLARAARGTGRYAELLDLLARLPAERQESVRQLRDQIAEEMQVRGMIERGGTACAASDRVNADAFRATRVELLAGALRGRHADRRCLHIFSCTDGAYLAGAAVCMFSLLQHNAGRLGPYRVTVFCADEAIELAAAVFGRIGAVFGVPIEVRPASRLVSQTIGFRTQWGVFTAGRGLSRAAYYRIYAARHFIDEGLTGRALYIDADTCVFSGLPAFAEFDLAGQPLAACLDDADLSTIRRAARLLGLDPRRYFNSGVLLFDLDHPGLRELLDRAIEISLGEQERLTFVDQCALNLAFRGRFAELPSRFNGFVKPEAPSDDLPVNPVIMHFISAPKPWDTMYDTANCMPWIDAFADMGRVMPADVMRQLLALHYPAAAGRGAEPESRPA